MDSSEETFQTVVVYLTVIQTIFLCLPLIGYFHPDLTHEQYLYYWSFFKTLAFFLIVVILLKLLLRKKDSENGTGTLEKCKRDYIICFGGITLISVVTHIVLLIASNDLKIMMFATFLPLGLSSVLLSAFGIPASWKCYLKSSGGFALVNHLLHFIIMAITWIFKHDDEGFHIAVVSAQGIQLWFTCPLIPCFYSVMNDEISLNWENPEPLPIREDQNDETDESEHELSDESDNENEENHIESSDESDNEDEVSRYKESECKVCFRRYQVKSGERTARIWTSCGHTVCHKCLSSLLKKNKSYVMCPFCKKRTYVSEGSAVNLPKNYAIIGLIEEIEGASNENVMG